MPEPAAPSVVDLQGFAVPDSNQQVASIGTTVIHPLELELSLLQSQLTHANESLQPPGSGATARLHGTLEPNGHQPTTGTLTFQAGPNKGRVLRTDTAGRFGASNLYQGLSILLIESDRGLVSEREVMLRQLGSTLLDVSLSRGDACLVRGRVKDRKAEPIARALVRIDGQETQTDDQGEFFFPRISSGKVLAIVRAPGMAHYREELYIPRNGAIQPDKLTFTLDPEVRLDLSVEAIMGSGGASTAYVFPIGGQRVNTGRGQRTYPWHLVNPIEIPPGRTISLAGLPEGHVSLMVFHPGSTATPALENKKLFAGRRNQHSFSLQQAPTLQGRVVMPDGEPARGAHVVLEAPDVGLATTKVMQQKFTHNLSMVLPHLPAGHQSTQADEMGRFVMTLHPKISKGYYLSAVSADGQFAAARGVGALPESVELHLAPVQTPTGEITVHLKGRFQGLPVRITLQGAPADPFVLEASETLKVDGLEAGVWRAELRWNGERILQSRPLSLGPGGHAEVSAVLPLGALEGQSVEERRRAGKLRSLEPSSQ